MAEHSLLKPKKHRELTQEAFDKLLCALHADRTLAAEQYEHIRQALLTFFAFRGATNALELADETINRVAWRLHEGAEIFVQNPVSYFYGFARNIWREVKAQPIILESWEETPPPHQPHLPDPHELLLEAEDRRAFERRLQCLEHCLQTLSVPDRELMVEYYQGSGGLKIENRQELAARFGITHKTLRNKTSKLRRELAECVQDCLAPRSQ
jgi:DNA-directed RNA polymerase specialized sigma24 family protein